MWNKQEINHKCLASSFVGVSCVFQWYCKAIKHLRNIHPSYNPVWQTIGIKEMFIHSFEMKRDVRFKFQKYSITYFWNNTIVGLIMFITSRVYFNCHNIFLFRSHHFRRNRNYSAILATLQITSYALGV